MNLSLPKNLNLGLPEQMQSSRNFLIEIVLLFIVCGLFTWFVILPKKTEVDNANTTLIKSQEDQKNMSGLLKSLNDDIAQIKTHQDDIKELDDALPLQSEISNPQILIQSLADSAGVTVGDINLQSKDNSVIAGNTDLINNPYGATRVLQKISGSIYVIGSFSQIENFLKKMETSGRLFEVSGLEIAGAQDSNLNLKINLDTYYFAP